MITSLIQLSGDDSIWSVRVPAAHGLFGLFENPHAFVHSIQGKPGGGNYVLDDHFTITFMSRFAVNRGTFLVQGIHGTGVITIHHDPYLHEASTQRPDYLDVENIPLDICYDLTFTRVYAHAQWGNNATLNALRLVGIMADPGRYLQDITNAPQSGFTQTTTSTGPSIPSPLPTVDSDFFSSQGFQLIFEGVKSGVITPNPIACNVVVGPYGGTPGQTTLTDVTQVIVKAY